MGKALENVFWGLGFLMLVAIVLLYQYGNEEAKPSLYMLLLGSSALNFGIAIYLYRRNKKNN